MDRGVAAALIALGAALGCSPPAAPEAESPRSAGAVATVEGEALTPAIEREARARGEAALRAALFASVREELALSEEALRTHYEGHLIRR